MSFEWVVAEAAAAGLLFDDSRLAYVRQRTPALARPWAEPTHESLVGAVKALGHVPKTYPYRATVDG